MLSAGVAVLGVLLAWQLSQGPISLGFLKPLIERPLIVRGNLINLKIDDVILTWAGWERALDIRVINLRSINVDRTEDVRVPELSFSLSGPALAAGQLAPKAIELFGPELKLTRSYDGTIEFGMESAQKQLKLETSKILSWLVLSSEQTNQLDYLRTVSIVGAELSLEDKQVGKTWRSPVEYATITRTADKVMMSATLQLNLESETTEIQVSAELFPDDQKLFLRSEFSGFSPSKVAPYYGISDFFSDFDIPVDGILEAFFDFDGQIKEGAFDLKGGSGVVGIPSIMKEKVSIDQAHIKGKVADAGNRVIFEKIIIKLPPKSTFHIPPPVSHKIPFRAIEGVGQYFFDKKRLEIFSLETDLSGPIASFKGSITNVPSIGNETIIIKGESAASYIPIKNLQEYWPRSLGADAQEWSIANIKDGIVDKLQAEFEVHLKGTQKGKNLEIFSVKGDMTVNDAIVTYLDTMPPISTLVSYITFDKTKLIINIDHGTSDKISFKNGRMIINGLNEKDQFADLSFDVASAFPDALSYLDNAPLKFAKALDIPPKTTKGEVIGAIQMQFPIEKALTLQRIDIAAKANLKNIFMADKLVGHDIKNGQLNLSVNKKSMRVSGQVTVNEVVANINWKENFDISTDYKSRYTVKAHIADSKYFEYFGVNSKLLNRNYINGASDITILYTIKNDKTTYLEGEIDLRNMRLAIPEIEFLKDKGFTAAGYFSASSNGAPISEITRFELVSADLKLYGTASFDETLGIFRRINIDRLAFDRTDIKGAVIAHSGNAWEIGFDGNEFDFSALWDEFIGDNEENFKKSLPELTVAVELGRVWLSETEYIKNCSGTFKYNGNFWQTILLKGELSNGGYLQITMKPDSTGNRNLQMEADNAGLILKYLDYYNGMKGGKLWLAGNFDDSIPDRPLTAQLFVKDYRVTNAPLLARVLSIMALTGILDAMQGEGLGFAELKVPFVSRKGVLSINGATANGASLGFTATGTIYSHANIVEIDGTVVPAYMINSAIKSALDYIPLLGGLLTSQEDGGGVFAASFTMNGPQENPVVKINPLSALTPGILGDIFGILDDDKKGSKNFGKTKSRLKIRPPELWEK